jgi:effector-binding domain-containing protein
MITRILIVHAFPVRICATAFRGPEGDSMQYDFRLEEVSDNRPIAVIRRRARPEEFSKVIPEACGIVWGVLRSQQIKGAGRHVAVYLDDEVNLEIGVEMAAPFVGHGEVVGSSLPAGSAACVAHFGPYQKLRDAHLAIQVWCAGHGYALAGPNWEIYGHFVDEWNRDPFKIRTDVFYVLKAGHPSLELPSDAGAPDPENVGWAPYHEPILTTLARTFTIALVVGGVLAWRTGRLANWPIATLVVLWLSFGGHWVELFFLNILRPRLPTARAAQTGARLAVWFIGGAALAQGMKLTVLLLEGSLPMRWPAWWIGGLAFIGVELIVHLLLHLRGRPSLYTGRG